MTELKGGDRIKLKDGEIVEIVGSWGQGRHKAYRITDDRILLDLHVGVEDGSSELLGNSRVPRSMPLRITEKPLKSNFTPVEEDLPMIDGKDIKNGEDLED